MEYNLGFYTSTNNARFDKTKHKDVSEWFRAMYQETADKLYSLNLMSGQKLKVQKCERNFSGYLLYVTQTGCLYLKQNKRTLEIMSYDIERIIVYENEFDYTLMRREDIDYSKVVLRRIK